MKKSDLLDKWAVDNAMGCRYTGSKKTCMGMAIGCAILAMYFQIKEDKAFDAAMVSACKLDNKEYEPDDEE